MDIIGDMQTTITSGLAGGLAGTLADRAGYIMGRELEIEARSDTGSLAMRFALDSLASAGLYYVVARAAPETASNAFFAFIFFTANRHLVASTIELAERALAPLL